MKATVKVLYSVSIQVKNQYAFIISFSALMGFISRQEAEDYLHKSETGTFLIRFSDSELGGVTVAWITGEAWKMSRENKKKK